MLHVTNSLNAVDHEVFFPLRLPTGRSRPMSEDKYIFKMDNLKAFPKGKTSRLPLDLKLQRKCLGSPLYKTLKGLYKRDGGSLPNRYNIVTRLLAHNRSLRENQQLETNFEWKVKKSSDKREFKLSVTMPPYSMITASRPEFFSGFLGFELEDEAASRRETRALKDEKKPTQPPKKPRPANVPATRPANVSTTRTRSKTQSKISEEDLAKEEEQRRKQTKVIASRGGNLPYGIEVEEETLDPVEETPETPVIEIEAEAKVKAEQAEKQAAEFDEQAEHRKKEAWMRHWENSTLQQRSEILAALGGQLPYGIQEEDITPVEAEAEAEAEAEIEIVKIVEKEKEEAPAETKTQAPEQVDRSSPSSEIEAPTGTKTQAPERGDPSSPSSEIEAPAETKTQAPEQGDPTSGSSEITGGDSDLERAREHRKHLDEELKRIESGQAPASVININIEERVQGASKTEQIATGEEEEEESTRGEKEKPAVQEEVPKRKKEKPDLTISQVMKRKKTVAEELEGEEEEEEESVAESIADLEEVEQESFEKQLARLKQEELNEEKRKKSMKCKTLERRRTQLFRNKYKGLYERLQEKKTRYFSLIQSGNPSFAVQEESKTLMKEASETLAKINEIQLKEQAQELAKRKAFQESRTKRPRIAYSREEEETISSMEEIPLEEMQDIDETCDLEEREREGLQLEENEETLQTFGSTIITNYSANPLTVESTVTRNLPLIGRDDDSESAWKQWCAEDPARKEQENRPPHQDADITIGYHLLERSVRAKVQSQESSETAESLSNILKHIFKREFGLRFHPLVQTDSRNITISDKPFNYEKDLFKLNIIMNPQTQPQGFTYSAENITFSKQERLEKFQNELILELSQKDAIYQDPLGTDYPIVICLQAGSGTLGYVENFGMVNILGVMYSPTKLVGFNKIFKIDEAGLKVFFLNKDGKKLFINGFKFSLYYMVIPYDAGKNPTIYL